MHKKGEGEKRGIRGSGLCFGGVVCQKAPKRGNFLQWRSRGLELVTVQQHRRHFHPLLSPLLPRNKAKKFLARSLFGATAMLSLPPDNGETATAMRKVSRMTPPSLLLLLLTHPCSLLATPLSSSLTCQMGPRPPQREGWATTIAAIPTFGMAYSSTSRKCIC